MARPDGAEVEHLLAHHLKQRADPCDVGQLSAHHEHEFRRLGAPFRAGHGRIDHGHAALGEPLGDFACEPGLGG